MKVGITQRDSSFSFLFPTLEVVTTGKEYDLIIFPGGADISPTIYNQENKYSSVSKERDDREIAIYNYYQKRNTKFLGICRGHQFLNAITGGQLVQDLVKENFTPHNYFHPVELINNGLFSKTLGERVNSTHHQGVIIPGREQIITATYEGIIETTESERIITTQCHPEYFDFNLEIHTFFDAILNWVTE